MLEAAIAKRKKAETDVPMIPPTASKASKCFLSKTEVKAMATDKPKTIVEWPSEKKKSDADGPFAFLHQLARHVVNRRDMIRIHGVTQTKRVSQKRRAEQNWMIMKSDQRPNPRAEVDADEQRIHEKSPAFDAVWKNGNLREFCRRICRGHKKNFPEDLKPLEALVTLMRPNVTLQFLVSKRPA
jgi:hypothetical protein